MVITISDIVLVLCHLRLKLHDELLSVRKKFYQGVKNTQLVSKR